MFYLNKIVNKYFIILITSLLLIVSGQLFSQSICLDSVAIDAVTPNIAADGNGHLAVFWSADTDNSRHPQNLYHIYSTDKGITFTFPEKFPFYGNSVWYENVQPNLLYDSTGKLNFVWTLVSDTLAPVFKKSNNYGLNWRAKIETGDLGGVATPSNYGVALAASSDGQNLKIIWYNLGSSDTSKRVFFGYSNDGGTNWQTDNITSLVGVASVGYMSSAVMDSNNNFYALSYKNSKLNITRCIDDLWSSIDITPISTTISLANEHSMIIDNENNLYITWSQDSRVYFSKSTDQGLTWSPKYRIYYQSSTSQEKSVIGLDTHGELVVVWQSMPYNSNSEIYWVESEDLGSTWSQGIKVSPSTFDQTQPDITLIGKGIHVVWIEQGKPLYTKVSRPIMGDVDELGQVDLLDFSIISGNWLNAESVTWQMGDLTGDDVIDFEDISILAEYWLDMEIAALSHIPLYDDENLFPNSTFDDFTGALPTAWLATQGASDTSEFLPGRDGTGSCLEILQIDPPEVTEISCSGISIESDAEYVFKGYYAADLGNTHIIGSWKNGIGTEVGSFSLLLPDTQSKWESFFDELVSPVNAVSLEVIVNSDISQNILRLDDFSLRRGTLADYAVEFDPSVIQDSNEVFPIFAWVPPGYYEVYGSNTILMDSEKLHAELACANFTLGTEKAKKYGSGKLVNSVNTSDTDIQRAGLNDKVWGFLGKDEPSHDMFATTVLAERNRVKGLVPSKPYFNNLYPNYATTAQLGTSDYTTYVRDYLSIVNPDYVTFDHYTLADGGEGTLFYSNFETIRTEGLDAEVPYGAILQSAGWGGLREPSEADMRWQAYSALAYGSKILGWFTYLDMLDLEDSKGAIVNVDGNRTPLYSIVKNLNSEVIYLGYTLLNLTSTGVYHSVPLPTGTTDMANSTLIDSVSSGQWVVGEFVNNQGEKFLMLVNRSLDNLQNSSFVFKPAVQDLFEVSKITSQENVVPSYNTGTNSFTMSFLPGEGKLFHIIE